MEYLLLVISLNYQAVYPNAETCLEAATRLTEAGHEAVCIPKGEDKIESIFNMFTQLIKNVGELEE